MLAAAQRQIPCFDYTPQAVKLAVCGSGSADKRQVQQMIKLLLGLDKVPSPHDAADALAVAICHAHSGFGLRASGFAPASGTRGSGHGTRTPKTTLKSWRQYRPA